MTSEPLDRKTLRELRSLQTEGEPSLLRELVGLFLSDLPPRIDQLLSAVADGDAVRARHVAHTIKGSSGSIGAVRLFSLSRHIEDLSARGNLNEVKDLLQDVRREFELAQLALKEELKSEPE